MISDRALEIVGMSALEKAQAVLEDEGVYVPLDVLMRTVAATLREAVEQIEWHLIVSRNEDGA